VLRPSNNGRGFLGFIDGFAGECGMERGVVAIFAGVRIKRLEAY
jgi:hypothetical protein